MQNLSAFWAVKLEILTTVSVSRPLPPPQSCPLGIGRSGCTGWWVSDLSAPSWKQPHKNVSKLYCLMSLQVFHLKPGLSLRSTFLAQFLLVLHRKALTLIKYIEDDTWVSSSVENLYALWVSVSFPLSNVCIIMFGFFLCLFVLFYL